MVVIIYPCHYLVVVLYPHIVATMGPINVAKIIYYSRWVGEYLLVPTWGKLSLVLQTLQLSMTDDIYKFWFK